MRICTPGDLPRRQRSDVERSFLKRIFFSPFFGKAFTAEKLALELGRQPLSRLWPPRGQKRICTPGEQRHATCRAAVALHTDCMPRGRQLRHQRVPIWKPHAARQGFTK